MFIEDKEWEEMLERKRIADKANLMIIPLAIVLLGLPFLLTFL